LRNSRKVWLACGASLGLPLAGAAQTVQHVEVTEAKGQVNVHVVGDNLPKPKEILWNQTNGITLEWDAALNGKGERIPIAASDVTAVWYGWFSARPKKIRVKVQADKQVTSVIKKSSDGWTITVGDQTTVPAQAQTKPVTAFKEVAEVPAINSKQAQDEFWKSAGGSVPPAAHTTPKVTNVASAWTNLNPVIVPEQQLKKVSLDVTNGDLAQVLKMLAMESGANIIIGPSVVGKVTADLHEVTIDQALQFVAQITGVHYTKVDGTYVFVGEQEMKNQALTAHVQSGNKTAVIVPIMSGDPDRVKMAIKATLGNEPVEVYTPAEKALAAADSPQIPGQVAAPAASTSDSKTGDNGYLLLVGTSSAVHDAEATAREIDDSIVQARNQYNHRDDTARASDELVAYDVKFADPRALRELVMGEVPGLFATVAPNAVANWQVYQKDQEKKEEMDFLKASNGSAAAMQQQQSNASSTSSGPVTSTNQVDDTDLEQPFSKEESSAVPMRLILRGSHAKVQEAIEMLKMMDTPPRQVALEMRVMMMTKEQAINAGIDWSVLTGGAVKVLNLNNSYSTPSNTVGVGISAPNVNGSVTASLDAISDGNNLIARPNLVAMDGRQSEIFVGDIIRYVESIQASQNGTTVTTGEVPVGVRLSVLPRVGADGNITLDLRPRISILDSFTQVPGGGELPQTSTRFAQSTLTIKSGETLAIGGLIQDQDVKNATGIPWLMDLPILGHLFKQTSNTKTRTELVIFLTAKSIDGPVRADGAAPLPFQPDLKFGSKVGN